MAVRDVAPWQLDYCAVCGFTWKAQKLIEQYGRYVCPRCFDKNKNNKPRRYRPQSPGYGQGQYGVNPYGS